jgi:2-polyprenyl-3-methyl-5-hydroxy-6-metoxy-1,4-benzoquinol methylase
MNTDNARETASGWPAWCDPATGEPLAVHDDCLLSPSGQRFPIIAGIPRFVPAGSYADAFGEQWKKYRLTQLDSHTGQPISRDRLRHCLGPGGWESLPGQLVLEAGCGAGRFTEVLLDRGARVLSIDMSEAVEANQLNFPQGDHHRIAQADILHLSLPKLPTACFDVVICLGVLQHTPKPRAALAALADQVRPGGLLVIDHYARSLSQWTRFGAMMLRPILKRLPARQGIAACEQITRLFLPLHKLVRRWPIAQKILSRFSPAVTYYHLYPQLAESCLDEWALLDTHDALTDWYKHHRSVGQVHRAMESLGLEEIWGSRGGNGVEARGRRPVCKVGLENR